MNYSIIFVLVVVCGIVVGSLWPSGFANYDKQIHIISYALLFFSLCWSFPKYRYLWVILVPVAGGIIEVLQALSPVCCREFSYGDMAANVAGVLVGFIGFALIKKLYEST